MTPTDVEVVRAAFASWDPDDFEAAAVHLHPEVEYREDPSWPGSETHRGREAVMECFGGYDALMGFSRSSVEQVVAVGDQVVVVLRVAVKPQGSAHSVEHRWGYVCRVREERVGFFQAYVEPDEAFAAAASGSAGAQ